MAELSPQPQNGNVYVIRSANEINGTCFHVIYTKDLCCNKEENQLYYYDSILYYTELGTVVADIIDYDRNEDAMQEKCRKLQIVETAIEQEQCENDFLTKFCVLEKQFYLDKRDFEERQKKRELDESSGAVVHKRYVTQLTKNNVRFVQFGPNETEISFKKYKTIDWSNARKATKCLLSCCFDRETLATSSITGKPSPAAKSSKVTKKKLNPIIVADIVDLVKQTFDVSQREVHKNIATKCAEARKLLDNETQKQKCSENQKPKSKKKNKW